MKLIFVRHGQSDHNKSLKLNETNLKPSQLTPTGRQQAKEAGKKLAQIKFACIYSSEINRAVETAEIIKEANAHQPLTLKTDERVNELHVGMDNQYALVWYLRFLLHKNKFDHKNEGGESFTELATRIQEFLNDTNHQHHHNDTVLLVSHLRTYQMSRHLILGEAMSTGLLKNRLTTGGIHTFKL